MIPQEADQTHIEYGFPVIQNNLLRDSVFKIQTATVIFTKTSNL